MVEQGKGTDVQVEFQVDVGGEPTTFVVRPPDWDDLRAASLEYDRSYERLRQAGAKTRGEAVCWARARGLWTDDLRDEAARALRSAVNFERAHRAGAGEDLGVAARRWRAAFRRLVAGLREVTGLSAEDQSRQRAVAVLTAACTFHQDGRRVFADADDLVNRSTTEVARKARAVVAELVYGFRDDEPDFQDPGDPFGVSQ